MAGRKPKMMKKGGAPKMMRKGGAAYPKGMKKGGAVKKSKNGANGGSLTIAKARAFLKDQGYKVSRIS
jgi:hypothetical protein